MDATSRALAVRLVIFDVDGVLTDGRLFFGPDGETLKVFHVRDGLGISLLRQAGLQVAIISGRRSDAVRVRLGALGVEHIYQGHDDKLPVFERLLATLGLRPEQVAYMGDDLPDVPIMARVGLPCAVADAHPLVAEHALWHSTLAGGRGAARELCEFILAAQNRLEEVNARFVAVDPDSASTVTGGTDGNP